MSEKMKKNAYCQYDPSIDFERAVGGLRIFIPAERGYVNYNFVHSVCEEKNCDVWRLSKAYAFDDNFENEYELTPKGAEWDMALRLSGRPDFIGGYAHGDEIFTSLSVEIDGESVAIESLTDLTPFEEIIIKEESKGFDPSDPTSQALNHFKEYVVSGEGIILNQKVEWLNDYTLGSSYMAMMPPLKSLTDRFYTNADPTPKEALSNYGSVPSATEAVVYGKELAFSMSVPRYPSLVGGNKFLLTDNRGKPYNKMYFVICNGAEVSKGDVWETTTKYSITNKNSRETPVMADKKLQVLFVGNSYTYYNQMPEAAFTDEARSAGYEVEVTAITHGGYRLCQYADPENEEGKRLRETVAGKNYDFAVLQEQSHTPITNEAQFLEGVKDVMSLIDADKFILYATWGRNDGCELLDELGLTSDEMTEKLSAAYNKAAELYGARVAEVGKAFVAYSAFNDKNELYKSDNSHPSAIGSAVAAKEIFKQMVE